MKGSRVVRGTLLAAIMVGLTTHPVDAQGPSGLAAVAAIEDAVVDAIARAERSVVAIARVRKSPAGEVFGLEFRPDPFDRPAMPAIEPKPTDPDFIPNEFATGVVVDPRGLILTAYHVLGEDSDYYVTTHERKVYRAWVKGADPRSDLAVLAVDASDLEPIRFASADKLRKGQIVLALGNPHAIARDGQASASWGIVANLTRKAPPSMEDSELSRKSTLHHFGTLIQTDAKLNLGTSGGALVNLRGEMVGLTTALAATAGYEQSAGYAYPVDDTFRRVVEALKQGREVEYGYLGIQPGNLSSQEVLAGLSGTRVYAVLPGTPAAKYGLQVGDLITSVDGRPVYDADSLVLSVGRLPVESVVRMGVLRGGRSVELKVTLSKYPVRGKKIVTTPAPDWRGLRVDYLTAVLDPAGRSMYELPSLDAAVAVTDVEEGSPAWEAGLRARDLIRRVEERPVSTPREFHAAVVGKTGAVRLSVSDLQGAGTTRTVPES